MKKVIMLFCALVLTSCFSLKASAEQAVSGTDIRITQAFCQDSKLYAYVSIPEDKESNSLIAKAVIDSNYSFKQSEPIAQAGDTSEPVSYLFLLDISTSMPRFEDNVKAFIGDFMSDAGKNARYALATFGDKFEVKSDFSNNFDDINKKLDEIKYDVKQTSLYSSIVSAIDYIGKKGRSGGELYNIVVITDGIEYDKSGITADKVLEKIKSSQVFIHTFGLSKTDGSKSDKETSEEALKILGSFAESSLGIPAVLGRDNKTESDLAGEITGYVNSLYLTRFNISGLELEPGSYDLKLVFATAVENGDFYEAHGTLLIPDSDITAAPVPTLIPQPGKISAGSSAAAETGANADGSVKNFWNIKILGIFIWIIILIAIIIIIILLSLLTLLKKRKKPVKAAKEGGIFIKAAMVSDNCSLADNQFYLSDELFIGRDKECDIRLNNKDVSKKNSRIYVRDNVIYIEDLNSTNGTSINNMKIFSPNKLRSGDVISIGSVEFLFRF